MKLMVTSIAMGLAFASCNKGTKVLGVSKTELSAASVMSVTSLIPLAAKPGTLVIVKGSGFDSQSRISIDGQSVKLQNISSDGASGEFIMPQTSRAGAFTVALGTAVRPEGGSVADVAKVLLADSAGDGLPIYMAKPADICSDTKFRDAQGVAQVGTKVCSTASSTATASPTATATTSSGSSSVSNCATDGDSNCYVTGNFKAANTTTFAATDVLTGKTIAGVAGTATASTISNCTADGQTDCISTVSYTAASTSGLAAKVLSTATVAGVTGSIGVCADAEQGCYIGATGTIKAAQTSGVVDGDLKSGKSLAGISGSLANCSTDGGTSCVAVTNFPAADKANSGPKIVSGQSVAGISGTAVTSQLTDCNSDGQQACTANASFKAAQIAGLGPKLIPTAVVAGVSSTASTCLTDGSQNCYVTTGAIKAADTSSVSTSDIKSGKSIAGITGALANCSSGGTTGCVTVAGYPSIDAADLATKAWDIRAGQTIGSVTGKLRANCRNMVNTSRYNYDGLITSIGNSSTTTGTTADIWDSIDDSNNQTATIPTVNPWSANEFCGGISTAQSDDNIWLDVTTTGNGATASSCTTTATHCSFKDKLSGLEWSKLAGSSVTLWSTAVKDCNLLNTSTPAFNGKTGWRLPTLKELLSAYVNGILTLKNASVLPTFLNGWTFASNFWAATTDSGGGANAWTVNLESGLATSYGKNGGTSGLVLCVRP